MARNTSNRILLPEARQALDSFKMEVASELGLSNYASMDKGNLTARQNGYVGGMMVKKMIAQAESQMSGTTMGSNIDITTTKTTL